MYHWKFNSTAGSYALFDGDRPMNLNPPPDCVTDDMKRIARALNMEAAMWEVLDIPFSCLEEIALHYKGKPKQINLMAEAGRLCALAALDRVEGV